MFYIKCTKTSLLIIFFLLSFFFDSWGQDNYPHPYILKQIQKKAMVEMVHVSDLNNDQNDEFILKVEQAGAICAIRVYANDLKKLFYQKNFRKHVSGINTLNWDQKGFKEILFTEKDEHWINLLLMSTQNTADTLSFMPLISLDEFGQDVSLGEIRLMDINNDGYTDIIIAISSGLNPKLRAIWAIDLKNKNILWRYPLATNIRKLELSTLNLKEIPYLLVSTQAPANGYHINNMSDIYSYAVALDAISGEQIFLKELGYGCSLTDFKYFNSINVDRPLMISVTANMEIKFAQHNKIILWDWNKQSIIKFIPKFQIEENIHIADIDNDGVNELLRSGKDDKIIIYDGELIRMNITQFANKKVRIDQIFDINHDGLQDYIIETDDYKTAVLNDQMEIIAEIDFGRFRYPVNRGESENYALAILDKQQKIFKIFELRRNWVSVENTAKYVSGGIIIGILATIIFIIMIYFFKRKKLWLKNNAAVLENLSRALIISDHKDKIIVCNHDMEQLLGVNAVQLFDQPLKKALSILKVRYDSNTGSSKNKFSPYYFQTELEVNGVDKKLKIVITKLVNKNKYLGHLITANDITRSIHYKNSMAWTSMAQRLAHEIKNPLTTVKLSLQRLKMEYEEEDEKKKSKYDTYVDSTLEEVIRLRKVSENFMKLCQTDNPVFEQIKIADIFENIKNKYMPSLPPETGLCFNIKNGLPIIEADPDQLEIMIDNLIDNALKAIRDNGRIEIKVNLIQKIETQKCSDYVQIEVEDNGMGIEEKNIDKIFNSFVSGDENGTGLGLAIVKRIIENHRGEVKIISTKNVGTLVTLIFPVNQK